MLLAAVIILILMLDFWFASAVVGWLRRSDGQGRR